MDGFVPVELADDQAALTLAMQRDLQTRRGTAKSSSEWVLKLIKCKPAKLVAVALADKMARIAWKLMVGGESYGQGGTVAAPAAP